LLDSSFRVKSGKKKTPVKEISVSRRNGEVFPCEVSISTAEISGRIYYTIILRDITDRKNAEEILRKSKEELEIRVKERTAELSKTNKELTLEVEKRKLVQEELRKADRLATIGKMSAVLAHEIRNPLNSIKINTDILFESKDISPDKKNRLQIVQKEVIRLNNLLKEVLMYARHTELIISEFNLNNLIESLRIQLNSNISEKEISFLNGLGNISIRGDIEKLKQVFLNLILNSIDAVPKGGTIEISYKKDESNISVFVKDNGAGIENPEKIFEPFYTTKNTGTGLGLSISQNIIELHWGSLKLLSSKKGETIFEIKLPV